MAHSISSRGILYHLFTPLPQIRSERNKGVFDHIADYVGTSSGVLDVFRVGNHLFSVIEMSLSPSHKFISVAEKAKQIFNTAGIGLSIPQIFSDIHSLCKSFTHLFAVQDLPYNDFLRTSKIGQAIKETFLDSIHLTNTVAQIILFVENVKLFLFEASHLHFLNGIYNLTSIIEDGVELVGEYFKLQYYHSPEAKPRNGAETAKLEEKKVLSWIMIAKNVSSIALSVILSYGMMISTVAAGSITVIPIVLLSLSTFWLTTKLVGYFYEKIIVETPAHPNLSAPFI